MGPAKDKRGIRENFANVTFFIREEWLFADKGILINYYMYIYIYIFVYIYIYIYILDEFDHDLTS